MQYNRIQYERVESKMNYWIRAHRLIRQFTRFASRLVIVIVTSKFLRRYWTAKRRVLQFTSMDKWTMDMHRQMDMHGQIDMHGHEHKCGHLYSAFCGLLRYPRNELRVIMFSRRARGNSIYWSRWPVTDRTSTASCLSRPWSAVVNGLPSPTPIFPIISSKSCVRWMQSATCSDT